MTTWTCTKCGSHNIRFMVSLIVASPMEFYSNLSKKNIAKKEVEVWGASWPTGSIYCMDCGFDLYLPKSKCDEQIYEYAIEKIARGESKDVVKEARQALEQVKQNVDKVVKENFDVD